MDCFAQIQSKLTMISSSLMSDNKLIHLRSEGRKGKVETIDYLMEGGGCMIETLLAFRVQRSKSSSDPCNKCLCTPRENTGVISV